MGTCCAVIVYRFIKSIDQASPPIVLNRVLKDFIFSAAAADTAKLGNEQSLKIKYNQQTVAIWPVFNSVIMLTVETWKATPFDVIISCFLVGRSMHGNHSVFRSQSVRYVPEKVVYATSI